MVGAHGVGAGREDALQFVKDPSEGGSNIARITHGTSLISSFSMGSKVVVFVSLYIGSEIACFVFSLGMEDELQLSMESGVKERERNKATEIRVPDSMECICIEKNDSSWSKCKLEGSRCGVSLWNWPPLNFSSGSATGPAKSVPSGDLSPFQACIFMMKEVQYLSWPNLLPEILGLVLRRLPSLADHVRLRAVCRPWRSNAQLDPLPPLLPWLTLLDGTFLSIPDGKIIRMPIPDKAFCSGSVDNWMFFMHSDGVCSLMNPFSKATVNISKLVITWFNSNSRYYNSHFFKLVAPSPLESSPGSLVVLILEGGRRIRICQPPIAVDLELHPCFSWPHGQPQLSLLDDITFFNGKLYDLSRNVLSIFEINYGLDGFEVFEADLSTKPGQWRCVSELGGQALFVGKHCSKSFPAGECTGVEEDCIYFICDYVPANLGADPLGDSGVYNMKSGNIKPLLSESAAVPQHHGGQWRPTWIFPADAM
ncbi:unnamed protein product [Miscanthus lutarioriparius]|uniref:KIB1-4 beta-propeller domain-containing protein n=1 Tax=Miscanthus lutarioriparius TaxID=422564 RepID=A0A811S7Z1_9POAL|nr:unnamed protein product [Miscanthus lutarioriparius]